MITPAFRSTLFCLILPLLALGSTALLHRAAPPLKPTSTSPGPIFSPDYYRLTFLGQTTLAADWMWIQALQDAETSHVIPGQHPNAFFRFMLATDLDDAFYDAYVSGANLLATIRNDGGGARDLLLKGEKFRTERLPLYPESFQKKYWDQSWWLLTTLGYVYLFELDNMIEAADAFQKAAELPGAPGYLKSLAPKLKTREGQYETGLRLIAFMLEGAEASKNQTLIDQLTERRKHLQVGQYLHGLNSGFTLFLKSDLRYRHSHQIDRKMMQNYFGRYLRESVHSSKDPWGGTLILDESGVLSTTTPRKRVFGL